MLHVKARGEAAAMPGDVGGAHACNKEAGAEAGRGGRGGDVSEERMPQRYLVQGREASSWSGDHRFFLNTEMSANSVPYDLNPLVSLSCCSVFVVSDSLRPHGLQQTRLPCPSTSPEAWSNSCPLTG